MNIANITGSNIAKYEVYPSDSWCIVGKSIVGNSVRLLNFLAESIMARSRSDGATGQIIWENVISKSPLPPALGQLTPTWISASTGWLLVFAVAFLVAVELLAQL